MKALVGVDGSSNSLAAVEFAGRRLSPDRDELVLAYASPEMSFGGEELLDPTVQARARTALSRAVFEESLARLPDAWRERVVVMESAGPPGATLLAAADEQAAEMIVVGYRGASLWERIMLGSVSRAVVHSAHVPVLVVKGPSISRESTEQSRSASQQPFRVLVAYDGQEFGRRITEVLGRLHWPPSAEGLVISVVEPMYAAELPDWLQHMARDPDVAVMADAWRKEHEQNVAAARTEVEQFRETLPPCFHGREVIIAEGRPAEQLLAMLQRKLFDLVVMGSRGRGAVSRLLLGSTSAQILAAAPTSVLIVR